MIRKCLPYLNPETLKMTGCMTQREKEVTSTEQLLIKCSHFRGPVTGTS